MTEPGVSGDYVIPAHRLPPGFAETVEQIPETPVKPRPAATVVLMRDVPGDVEVLLLKRRGTAGFVPGAYVFPGGRVDQADALIEWPVLNEEPPAQYWVAALRELFEEAGVLLAVSESGAWSADTCSDAELESWRNRLMNEEATLQDVLQARALSLKPDAMAYIAHWITPLVEPRRYDTRFFVAGLPRDRRVRIDEREMEESVWLTPHAAVQRFEAGQLPMVFPTIKTLQLLQQFGSVGRCLCRVPQSFHQAHHAAPDTHCRRRGHRS